MYGSLGIIGRKQIREAIEDGKFDNLPGKGKPLDLSENPQLTSAPSWVSAKVRW